ncbi:LysE family translocator [Halomonas halmophila]|uniref:Lysine transporter LysE n=1 Tax=Halomonas halmophila TaxID=252 RepID=A0A4Y4F1V8_9GAMM|nr:LysE family translocator [Halomonas halmophila]GED21138.1 lysine transporter LysE [Halomonas halmophila]
MTLSLLLSMSAFALAASISPGPVNIVAFASGTRHGLRASLRHVAGAALGFTLLLLMIGLGLHRLLVHWPAFIDVVRWAGVAFLLYLALKLALDNGRFGEADHAPRPSIRQGAIMQWLNPKAWLASLAGMGAYAANGDLATILVFALLYLVICYGSVACWAIAGAFLRHWLRDAAQVRWVNRLLAALLVASAAYLILAHG